jgi:hypothetical protein
MMKNFDGWRDLSLQLFSKQQAFDTFAIAAIDFRRQEIVTFSHTTDQRLKSVERPWLFDLASLTKPLSFGSFLLAEKNAGRPIPEDILTLSEHRSLVVPWGRLSGKTWREDIFTYPKGSGSEIYSDISALSAQVLIESTYHTTLQEWCSKLYGDNLTWWRDIREKALCVQHSSYRHLGEVHDPNAFHIADFTAHAGLFGSINGLAASLLILDDKFQLCQRLANEMKLEKKRFYLGFDTVSDPKNTLAGPGCPIDTFGHLGFTGTSFWISADKKWGQILLTNATKKYDYERDALQKMRRLIGTFFWDQVCAT